MIKVILPGGFLQERTYAIHILLYEFLGLTYSIEVSKEVDSYCIEFEGKQIKIQDRFFHLYAKTGTYLLAEAIPQTALPALHPALDGIVCIYGEDEFTQEDTVIECGVDLIASAFFMLSRWEEYADHTRDQHGRFPAHASLAMRAGFLHRPVVDEYAALLRKWLGRIGVGEHVFRSQQFRLSLHCDVDTALYYPSKSSVIRKVFFRLFKEGSVNAALNEIKEFRAFLKRRQDPYDTYDTLMDLAEKNHTKASFCFLVDGGHELDGEQMLHVPHVRKIFDHIMQRGHQTGIHFSYRTADVERLMIDESERFQAETRLHPTHGRQHFLRCIVPGTWNAWERAGVINDYTMGYPEAPGFRCGTCHPFPLFDIEKRRLLHVYEHPLIAMDVTFRRYRNSSPEQTIAEVRRLMELVRRYDGEFVLLWHNSSFAVEWKGWENVLEGILN